MLRLVLFLCGIVALATGLSWLADRPGSVVISWEGYELYVSVFRAVVILALAFGLAVLFWTLLQQLWQSPAVLGAIISRRRQRRGLEALSGGMIAIGAGDKSLATRYALQARKSLPNEPLTHLLRAQAAQLSDDRVTSRRIFEAMLASPETEQLGLRGLFLEAEREGAPDAAKQFAERAVKLNPKLGWPLDALFEIQCRQGDWSGALEATSTARRHNHIDKATGDRRRAVLLCAQAQASEDSDPGRALHLAMEAHALAPDLIPAGSIAGRLLAARGNTPRASKVLQRTWRLSPHPELATAFAYARLGDSPRDRLNRVMQLASLRPYAIESPIAVATTAIEARDWDAARKSLEALNDGRMTQRACTLMARIEGEQHRDAGRVREWLARAVHAARDPAWTADGYVSDRWMPVSPVTGALDAFVWRVPVEAMNKLDNDALNDELERLVQLTAEAPAPELAVSVDAAPALQAEPLARLQASVSELSRPDYTSAQPAKTPDDLDLSRHSGQDSKRHDPAADASGNDSANGTGSAHLEAAASTPGASDPARDKPRRPPADKRIYRGGSRAAPDDYIIHSEPDDAGLEVTDVAPERRSPANHHGAAGADRP